MSRTRTTSRWCAWTAQPIRIADRPGRPGTPTRLMGFGTTVDTGDIAKAVFP
ncbi:hypothetical protein [Amycolatopsis sp. WAC 01375]|uniref:hypothetical protein n=1 Tax=Amycolatopsis sp. WAC 01375 TaxID=2203194 RepID=UPI002103A64A|nr:hypothetical protein [Amycolatopsis sp. WAC 01375]